MGGYGTKPRAALLLILISCFTSVFALWLLPYDLILYKIIISLIIFTTLCGACIFIKIIKHAHRQIQLASEMVKTGEIIASAKLSDKESSDIIKEISDVVSRYKKSNSDILHLSNSVIETVLEMTEFSSQMLNANKL